MRATCWTGAALEIEFVRGGGSLSREALLRIRGRFLILISAGEGVDRIRKGVGARQGPAQGAAPRVVPAGPRAACGHASSTDALSDAIDALAGADQNQETASDAKESLTAQRAASANELYLQCRAVQHVARMVYTNSGPVADANLTAGRTRFS